MKNYLLNTKIKYSLIIHGDSISSCTSKEGEEIFWDLIQHSRSIICCRCSPIQKSQIVRFVRKYTNKITLAIGDGENDVSMIKAAHIGVGIFGKEGYQAAYNSDFAFNQFKYLTRLLFINGRFTLLRNSSYILLYLFKNAIYTFLGMSTTFLNFFSGTFFYDDFYAFMFNTFISIIPLIIYSFFDEDFEPDFKNNSPKEKKMLSNLLPNIYSQTRDSRPINFIKYLASFISGIIFVIIILLIHVFSYENLIKNNKGINVTKYELCFYIYFTIVIMHFYMVYLCSSNYCPIVLIAFTVQILANILIFLIYDKVDSEIALSGITNEIVKSLNCFLISFISCVACCLLFYILKRAEFFFGMSLIDIIQQNKLELIFIGKFYKRKVDQMIRATRSISKFKKIYKNLFSSANNKDEEGNQYENLVDRNMQRVVEHYESHKGI